MSSKQVMRITLLSTIAFFAGRSEMYPYDPPPVCGNRELRRAIRTINDACADITCDFSKLHELEDIDKGKLLAALRNPYLRPVHLFFPKGQTQLGDIFDWRTTKKAQLDSIKLLDDPQNSVVFVIGRASVTGNHDTNVALSRERMLSVMKYVKDVLQVKCHKFKGGWLGKEYLQLSRSDAALLNLEPRDYRGDELVLNQAVHVFVFPCPEVL